METMPQRKYNLLSFDGGGMRGYGSMLILERLMEHVETIEGDTYVLKELLKDVPGADCRPAKSSFHPYPCPPGIQKTGSSATVNKFLPCHYFDCMIGTSTGGLISIMLGRLRMTVTDVIEQYQNLGQEIFGSPRWFHYRSFPPWFNYKYDHEKLNTAVKKVVENHDSSFDGPNGFPNASFNKTDFGVCSTIVAALGKVYDSHGVPLKKNGEELDEVNYLFQTYDSPNKEPPDELNLGRAFRGPVWWVARACSAAPTYFIPKEIQALNGNIWRFKDAGLVLQNPTKEGINELLSWRPEIKKSEAFNAVVSIGTGIQPKPGYFGQGKSGGFWDTLAVVYAGFKFGDPEAVHVDMEKDLNHLNEPQVYWRLNSDSKEWGNIMLDQCDKGSMEKMKNLADAYLKREDVKAELEDCAKSLVKSRRERQLNKDGWERFALAVEYCCNVPGCFNHYNLKGDMESHIARCHPGQESGFARKVWKYE